jgi:hypothetical protein
MYFHYVVIRRGQYRHAYFCSYFKTPKYIVALWIVNISCAVRVPWGPSSNVMCGCGGGWLRLWRAWLRPACVVAYLVFIFTLVPILIANSVRNGFKRREQVWLVGSVFVLLAIPISIWEIIQHMVHYSKPSHQKHIIR